MGVHWALAWRPASPWLPLGSSLPCPKSHLLLLGCWGVGTGCAGSLICTALPCSSVHINVQQRPPVHLSIPPSAQLCPHRVQTPDTQTKGGDSMALSWLPGTALVLTVPNPGFLGGSWEPPGVWGLLVSQTLRCRSCCWGPLLLSLPSEPYLSLPLPRKTGQSPTSSTRGHHFLSKESEWLLDTVPLRAGTGVCCWRPALDSAWHIVGVQETVALL